MKIICPLYSTENETEKQQKQQGAKEVQIVTKYISILLLI